MAVRPKNAYYRCSMPTRRTSLATGTQRPLAVVGAGVDVPFGLPMVTDMVRGLAVFCSGDGRAVDKALRRRVPNVRLRFNRIGGDTGDALVARLFEQPEDVGATLQSIQSRLSEPAEGPVMQVLDALREMATKNRVSPALAAKLAEVAGQSDDTGASDNVLDPQRIVLTPTVRTAVRTSFESVLLKACSTLTDGERTFIEDVVAAASNIENLLSSHFTRFAEGGVLADKRTYLYLSWILWAYLRLSEAHAKPSKSF